MAEFTYATPEPRVFMNTLRSYLHAMGRADIAGLLTDASYDVAPSGFYSGIRWNAYAATITFNVPIPSIPRFDDSVKETLLGAVEAVFPREAGYDITECELAPLLEPGPFDELDPVLPVVAPTGSQVDRDGLILPSLAHARLYDTLKDRNLLFVVTPTLILGAKNATVTVDFLICQYGRWGALEIDVHHHHRPTWHAPTPPRIQDYGLSCRESFAAQLCESQPGPVVDEFLRRLADL